MGYAMVTHDNALLYSASSLCMGDTWRRKAPPHPTRVCGRRHIAVRARMHVCVSLAPCEGGPRREDTSGAVGERDIRDAPEECKNSAEQQEPRVRLRRPSEPSSGL